MIIFTGSWPQTEPLILGSYVYWRHLGSTVRGLTFAVFVHASVTGSCVCVGVQTRVTCVVPVASLSVAGCGGCSGCPYSVGKIHSSFRHPRLIYRRHKITSEDSCDVREVIRPAFIKYSRGIGEATHLRTRKKCPIAPFRLHRSSAFKVRDGGPRATAWQPRAAAAPGARVAGRRGLPGRGRRLPERAAHLRPTGHPRGGPPTGTPRGKGSLSLPRLQLVHGSLVFCILRSGL
ncbi:unnamed protein product [Ixodes pacificus]